VHQPSLEVPASGNSLLGVPSRALWGLAVAAVLVIGGTFWSELFPLDDPYITLSNARVLLSGEVDPAYQTSYLTGATSAVHLLLVALFGLVVPPLWGSLLISLAGALAYFLALVRVVDSLEVSGRARAAILAFGALSGYSLIHYLNGLETSLAMAASAWMFVWCDDRRKLPLLAGLAPFLRPELGLFSALLLARLTLRSSPRQVAGMALRCALVCAPFASWIYAETGQLLPSTISAKYAWFYPKHSSLVERIVDTAFVLTFSLQLIYFVGLIGLRKFPCGRWAAAFVVIGTAVMAVVMPEIISWNFGRYTAIFFPLLVFGIAGFVVEKQLPRLLVNGLFAWTAATLAIASFTYVNEINYARLVQQHAKFVAQLPASSVVLVHDAGQVAWEDPKARLVDMVGLKTPAIVPINEEFSRGDCRREKALDRIGRKYNATHLAVLDRWRWPCVASDMRQSGWTLRPVYRGLYIVYALTPPRER